MRLARECRATAPRLSAEDTEFACGTFVVNASTSVVVEGVVLRDAPFWNCIVRGGSRNVVIDNVKVIGAWRYNSDGVDVAGCEDVIVRNCCIRSFDDCTVLYWEASLERLKVTGTNDRV